MGPPRPVPGPADRRGGLVLLVGVLVMTFLIVRAVSAHGWRTGWEQFGVDWPGGISLLDTRIITAAAESVVDGYDPMLENPHDPFHRPLNYPRVWHVLGPLGVRVAHTEIVGAVFIVLFVAGWFLAFASVDLRTGMLLLLFLVSPAVLYGVERGNNDLVVFFLLALGLWAGRRHRIAGLVPILCAAGLKIYPGFALACALEGGSRRALRTLAAAGALVLAYCLLTADDLRTMRQVTEHAYALSYGAATTALLLRERFQVDGPALLPALYGGCAALLGAAWLVGRRFPELPAAPGPRIAAFRVSAAVFCGTFVVWSSWDYRLMFLSFGIPQLLDWIDDTAVARDVRLAAWVTLILVFIVVFRTGSTPALHIVMTGLLFVWIGYLLARTLPRRLPSG